MERIVYEQDGGSWAVIRLRLDDGGTATAVGNLAPVFEGERLQIDGGWVDDARFGRQFRADKSVSVRPADATAIERYLASGVVPGIGPAIAARIVERFGDQTLEVFDQEPEKLLSVRGIGRVRLRRIQERWAEQAAERSTRIFLQGLGLGPFLTDKILRAWGDDTEQQVRDNPYALAASNEISGIGFRRADQIARQLPEWAAESEARARAGVLHVLDDQANRGHCFVPHERLIRVARELLEVDDDDGVRRAVAGLLGEGDLVSEPLDDAEVAALSARGSSEAEDDPTAEHGHRAVYQVAFLDAEKRVARRLLKIAATPAADGKPGAFSDHRAAKALEWVEGQLGVKLGSDQRGAVGVALSRKVLLVTGGPGTGKTTLIDAIVRCGQAVSARIALTAPTGRAAKRLSEATGHASMTIHRLLEYRPHSGGFGRTTAYPLEADVVVVDEASMIDLFLMDALVSAVPPRAVLVLVGDADQLPPVGPGAVLRDLLASEALPTVRLTEIYRQARRSLIVCNAHRVNQGEPPEGMEVWDEETLRDFYFIDEEDADRARNIALTLVSERIPARFGLDPMRDIQVLAPMHRGKAGVSRLNLTLQQRLNDGSGGRAVGDYMLRAGDRVIQQRNDYDRDVFNGDVGWVLEAEHQGALVVEFDGRRVEYDQEAARHLSLAYAISVHKSQGSEYPAVVVLLLAEHYPMLQRNLLYTALTRAKKLAVLVGSRRAVRRAVANAAPMRRCTRLARRLSERPRLPSSS
ncbi:MAG: ATP-dependent RecD-like DNA helicase [Acidobacteria bacterium]|nr:ATP-dependent RecD-like DNA helicase [Acidobacteriota bacterium]